MGVTFRADIRWENGQLLKASKYGVRVPPGLDPTHAREPIYVKVMDMQKRLRSSVAKAGQGDKLAIVNGLVDADLNVRYADGAKQWRTLPGPDGEPAAKGPGRFQFAGGDAVFELKLSLLLLDMYVPDTKDDLSVELFAAVYGHELLHVLDEVDAIKVWLPPEAKADPFVDKNLVKAEPFVYGTPSQGIAEVEREFRERITAMTHSAIRDGLWAAEVNRREGVRDAPTEYKKVQDVLDDLHARQVNRKH